MIVKKLSDTECKGKYIALITSLFSFNQVGTLHSSLRFLKVVCLSCSKLELNLPDDFHIRLLASTLHFLRLLELSKNNSTESPKTNGLDLVKENGGHQSKIIEMQVAKEGKCLGKEDIVEEGYCLVVSSLQGCDPVLLPELLEGLGDEIVSYSRSLALTRVFLSIVHILEMRKNEFKTHSI